MHVATLLKISAHGRVPSGQPLRADVGSRLVRTCQTHRYCRQSELAGVSEGLVASDYNDNRGPVRAVALGAPQSKWRIECRRAHVSSWFWPWFPQWPLAPRRPSPHRSRLFRKLPTPASSKNSARACLPRHGGPVPTLNRVEQAAVHLFPKILAPLRQRLCALRADWPIRPADCHDRRQDRC